MYRFKLWLVALAGLALLVVTLTHSLAPVGAASNDKGPRKFYLTRTAHTSAEARSACAGGYHMASLWEIFDTSNLRYDTGLGLTRDDSSFSPPTFAIGWIRTGRGANVLPDPGAANCNVWTEAGGMGSGTVVYLHQALNYRTPEAVYGQLA